MPCETERKKVEWSAPRLPGTNGFLEGRALLTYQVWVQGNARITPNNQSRLRLVIEEETMAIELVNTIECCQKTKPGMPFIWHERHDVRLDGFLYQSGPQATGADFNALGGTLHKSANRAEIRPKHAFCPIICVTDIVSHQAVLSAHVT